MNKRKISVVSVLIAAAALSTTARAASIDWDNGSGDGLWNTALNWVGDVVPAGDNDAVFVDTATPPLAPAVINADVPTFRDLRFGDEGRTGTGTVNHTAGNVVANGWMRMGINTGSSGIYNLSGGQLTTSRYNIGESGGATGVVNVTGGKLNQSDVADINNGDSWNRIGQDGTGTVNLSGTGIISMDSRTMIGAGGASIGLVNQTGGLFEVRRGELMMGDSSADAKYKISGGTLQTLRFHQDGNSGGNLTVGEWDNSKGTLEVSGTAEVKIATNFGIAQGQASAPNEGTVLQTGGAITFGGNGVLNTGEGGAAQDRSLGALRMSAATSSIGTYDMSGGTLRQNDMLNREDQGSWNQIGGDGQATFKLSGGTVSLDARTHIAQGGASVATINQTGGVFEVRRHELIIGDAGKATYNISGGTLQTLDPGRPIAIGNWDNSDSFLNVSGTGKVISAQDINVGGGQATAPAKATINQTGGTVTTTRRIMMANTVGGFGTYNLSGGDYIQSDAADIADGNNWSRIGEAGTATFNISGGKASFDSRLLIGGAATSVALVNQTGGTFEVRRGEFTLGDASASAVYKISAGTLQTLRFSENGDTGGNITVAQWDNSNARLEISGTAVVKAATNVQIADGRVEAPNTGAVLQSGGEFTFGGNGMLPTGEGGALQDRSFGGLQMARTTSGVATYTLSGGNLRQNDMNNREDQGGWNRIGQEGNATFNISGGTASFDSRTHIAVAGPSVSTVNQTGGVFEVRRHELIIGDAGKATYNISAGTLQTLEAGRPIAVGNWDNSDSNLNVSGTGQVISAGNLNLGGGQATAPAKGTATQTGGVVTVAGDVSLAAGTIGATGIYNLQGGVLDITGGNINTGTGIGTFNMTGGELRNAARVSGNSATSLTNPGAFVQGGGVLVVGATPGAGATTDIGGDYSLLAAGSVRFEIGDAIADRLTVAGTVTLAGNIELFAPVGTLFPQTFTILENDDVDLITGTFANAPNNTPFFQNGSTWRINYTGGDGNDAVVTLIIPEPSTAALVITGMALAFSRRRRTRA